MTDRKIHILFRGKTRQLGEIQRRELLYILSNIENNEGEKREKYKGKLERWLEAHQFIKEQIENQVNTWDDIADKLINSMGKTCVFDVTERVEKRLSRYLGGIK